MSSPRLRKEPFANIYERWLYSSLSDRAIRLLLVLDRYADKDVAFPNRKTLADRLDCSTDTIDRLIKDLEEVGAVAVDRVARPGGGRAIPHYYLWPATPDQSRTDAPLQSRTDAASRPHGCGQQSRNGADPDLYMEQEPIDQEPLTERTAEDGGLIPLRLLPDEKPLDQVAAVFDRWRETTGKARAVLDGKRRGLIERALRQFPAEDVLDAVSGWRNSPHHRGENDEGKVWNDIELLLRDAGRVEQFRDLERNPPRPRIKRSAAEEAQMSAEAAYVKARKIL